MSKLFGLFSRADNAASTAVVEPPGVREPDSRASATSDTESAILDCLGTVLQCWSHHPILLPDEQGAEAIRVISDWHRHATLGVPIPGVHEPDASTGAVRSRDWKTLASLTSTRRRAEAATAGEQIGELRRVVWDTVASLVRVAGEDAAADAVVEQQLVRLRACAQHDDAAALMRELPDALRLITEAIVTRQHSATQERRLMAERVASLGRALSEAEDIARTDPLTGVGNRLRFTEAMERALAMMTLSGSAVSLLSVDLDALKVINDTLGHPAGDIAIAAVAQACCMVCTRATDVVCRIGGDEFAVVMLNTDERAATALAERLTKRLQETPVALSDGISRLVTAAIGVSSAEAGERVEQWIARADQRLYEAKRSRSA